MAIQTVKTGAAVNDGTGDDARTAFTKINSNFTTTTHAASRLVGTEAGNVMQVGAFGLGNGRLYENLQQTTPLNSGIYGVSKSVTGLSQDAVALAMAWASGGAGMFIPMLVVTHGGQWFIAETNTGGTSSFAIRSAKNTQVDPNGFIKNASPIVSLYADKIELNDEAKQQPIIFEKLGVGDYLVKGSLGFAQEGWYIETPKDANGNVLVAVVYKQLANNDISVKTYDYMLNKKGRIVPDLETPLDIPSTRWIDLRLQALPQTNPLSKDETVATNAK